MRAGGESRAGCSKEKMLVGKPYKMSRTLSGNEGRVGTGREHRVRKGNMKKKKKKRKGTWPTHMGSLESVGSARLCSAEWVTRFISAVSLENDRKLNPNWLKQKGNLLIPISE